MSVPNVNFFIGYALPETRQDILEGKEKSFERQFYSSNQEHDYVQYVDTGSKEKIDYIMYSGNKEKSQGVFNENGLMSKPELKELRNQLRETKSVIWHGVISFEEKFGNTYCATTEKAIAMMKVEMPKFFKNAKLNPNNIVWYAGLHENTDNKHIHFSFFEKSPQRIKRGMEKPIFSDGHIKLEAINKAKTSMEIRLLDIPNEIYKNRQLLTHQIKENLSNGEFMKQVKILIGIVPTSGRISYDSENMRVYRPQNNKIISEIIKSDNELYDTYTKFERMLSKRDKEIIKIYSKLNLDYSNKLSRDKCITDLYRRLGNIVIQTAKTIRIEQQKQDRNIKNRLVQKRIERRKRQILLKHCFGLNDMVNREIVNSFQDYLKRLEEANYKRLQEEGYLD